VNTAANVVSAIGGIITAVGGLVLAVTVLIPTLRTSRAGVAATGDVHTIVNQERTDRMAYQQVLTDALRASGVAVPPDKSLG
jgi:hypothetical protein